MVASTARASCSSTKWSGKGCLPLQTRPTRRLSVRFRRTAFSTELCDLLKGGVGSKGASGDSIASFLKGNGNVAEKKTEHQNRQARRRQMAGSQMKETHRGILLARTALRVTTTDVTSNQRQTISTRKLRRRSLQRARPVKPISRRKRRSSARLWSALMKTTSRRSHSVFLSGK